jgi:hypothetical protein
MSLLCCFVLSEDNFKSGVPGLTGSLKRMMQFTQTPAGYRYPAQLCWPKSDMSNWVTAVAGALATVATSRQVTPVRGWPYSTSEATKLT